jgi:hypothetical protein
VTIEYNIINVQQLDISLAQNTYAWAAELPASLYNWIPPPFPAPLSNVVGSIVLGDLTTPPNFYTLASAVDAVLAKDSPSPATSLATLKAPLTMAQCSEIASELTYERNTDPPPEPPLPSQPPNGIELLYTAPDNQTNGPPSGAGPLGNITWVRRNSIRPNNSSVC